MIARSEFFQTLPEPGMLSDPQAHGEKILSVCFSLDKVDYRLPLGLYVIEDFVCERLSNLLNHNGRTVVWRQREQDAVLRMKLLLAEGSTRLARLKPGGGPATTVQIGGSLILDGQKEHRFCFGRSRKADFWEGSTRKLVEQCLASILDDVAYFATYRMRQAAIEAMPVPASSVRAFDTEGSHTFAGA